VPKPIDSEIHSEDLHRALPSALTDSTSTEVLSGEIAGLRTILHAVAPGESLPLEISADTGRVYVFISGSGSAWNGTTQEVLELALWAPRHNTPISVTASDSRLLFLELVIELSPTDLVELEQNAGLFPLFISYSNCKTYKEKIKSDKTISRTLLPEFTFPRLCVGSVQTTGDDRVAAHEHPMLEQLFLGLKDNNCRVHAGATTFAFGDGALLHIPLGSRHGVDVEAPHKLHYIWIDLFSNREGMQWIAREHIHETGS
jgi:mannose-6-phosphate isomerase-like protein (cupin superfamily)